MCCHIIIIILKKIILYIPLDTLKYNINYRIGPIVHQTKSTIFFFPNSNRVQYMKTSQKDG